jgi:hydrogenase-4 component B
MNAFGAEATLLMLLPALAPLWPLALLVALTLPPWRGLVLRLTPWAALPALLIAAAAPPTVLPLPRLLLDGSLQLDTSGRWLLAAVALLWLAGGWLATSWLCEPRRAVAFLLSMSGALWLPLAGDLPSVLAASVLAAYPLYGLLGGGRGARVLLASVVVADLLILEAMLLLVQAGAGLDFESLGATLVEFEGCGLVLALLLFGFGAKAGLMGLHYWLAPAMEDAPARQLAPATAFILAAGLLPVLRLLPLGGSAWPLAGAALPWLALVGGVWAVTAGLLQASPRARTAYALSALASLWLGLLGLGLAVPASSPVLIGVLPPATALSGLGLGALMLAGGVTDRQGQYEVQALALLSALLAMLAVLGAVLPAVADSDVVPWPLTGSLACVGILLGASARLPRDAVRRTAPAPEQRAAAVLVAGGLCLIVVAIPSSVDVLSAVDAWSGDHLIPAMTALFGGFAVGLAAVGALARLPHVPAGDLLIPIERAIAGLVVAFDQLGMGMAVWRDRFQMAIARMSRDIARQRAIDATETRLRRWSTATILLLIAGAAVALLVRPG